MKKNKKTYLLFIVVLIIWAVLGIKIFRTIRPMSTDDTNIKNYVKFTPPSKKSTDTFSILANYRDPFLTAYLKPVSKQTKKQIQAVAPLEKIINVLYTGYVKENNSGKEIFFLTIDGEQHMMYKNERIKEVTILSGTGEKIKINVAGNTKIISLVK